MSKVFWSNLIFGLLKTIYFVLATLSVSLFALNHSNALLNSVFACFSNNLMLVELIKNPVSSAKSVVYKFVAFGRSLMYNKNNIGPKTDP